MYKVNSKIKIQNDLKNIYYLEFETQYELCMTFVRLSSFYESPKFAGKFFTLEDFMDWYSNEYGNGLFTFTTDWTGANVPSDVYKKWVKDFTQKSYPFSKKEENLINKLSKIKDEKFYIIAGFKLENERLSRGNLLHETAHAFFHLSPEYKEKATKLINELPKEGYDSIIKYLKESKYSDDVLIDEAQAILSTIHQNEITKRNIKISEDDRMKLIRNFSYFYKNWEEG